MMLALSARNRRSWWLRPVLPDLNQMPGSWTFIKGEPQTGGVVATGLDWPSRDIKWNSLEAATWIWQLKDLEVCEGKEILWFKNFEEIISLICRERKMWMSWWPSQNVENPSSPINQILPTDHKACPCHALEYLLNVYWMLGTWFIFWKEFVC